MWYHILLLSLKLYFVVLLNCYCRDKCECPLHVITTLFRLMKLENDILMKKWSMLTANISNSFVLLCCDYND